MYADIYKNERLKGLTVVPVGLAYPAREGKTAFDSLCAGCHTMEPSDSVITPSLYGKAALLAERFRTAHHGKTLAASQLEDLKAYMDAYYRGEKILW
jgi:cytochrome c2